MPRRPSDSAVFFFRDLSQRFKADHLRCKFEKRKWGAGRIAGVMRKFLVLVLPVSGRAAACGRPSATKGASKKI